MKKILICLVLPFVIASLSFCSIISDFKSSNDYIESSGWSCSEDKFNGEYFKLIEDKKAVISAEVLNFDIAMRARAQENLRKKGKIWG